MIRSAITRILERAIEECILALVVWLVAMIGGPS